MRAVAMEGRRDKNIVPDWELNDPAQKEDIDNIILATQLSKLQQENIMPSLLEDFF